MGIMEGYEGCWSRACLGIPGDSPGIGCQENSDNSAAKI